MTTDNLILEFPLVLVEYNLTTQNFVSGIGAINSTYVAGENCFVPWWKLKKKYVMTHSRCKINFIFYNNGRLLFFVDLK